MAAARDPEGQGLTGAGMGRPDATFPALLKFWRRMSAISQEELAGACEVSVRHISYLENGKARPSAEMVGRLAGGLGLQPRERGALYHAAGFVEPLPALAPPDPDRRRADWVHLLRAMGATPAAILSSLGAVRAANRAWFVLHRSYLPDVRIDDRPLGALRLLLDPDGWRQTVAGWRELGMAMLSIAQQEALMTGASAVLAEVQRLSELAGFGADWPSTGARLAADASAYGYSLDSLAVPALRFRVIYASLGVSQPGAPRPDFLQSIHTDRKDAFLNLMNAGADLPAHPLLVD